MEKMLKGLAYMDVIAYTISTKTITTATEIDIIRYMPIRVG
jgi:hypothetical protein